MSKRPDRVEREVAKALHAIEPDSKPDWIATAAFSGIAVKLLRRERARLKRKVKGLPTVETTDFRKKILSVWVKRDDVLRLMEEE